MLYKCLVRAFIHFLLSKRETFVKVFLVTPYRSVHDTLVHEHLDARVHVSYRIRVKRTPSYPCKKDTDSLDSDQSVLDRVKSGFRMLPSKKKMVS